jgi:hypothetical protein
MLNIQPLSLEKFERLSSTAKKFEYLVNFAIQAPSGHNCQPWLFRLAENHLDLIADRSRALPVVDPHDRELTISCGAALEHLIIAARHYAYKLDVEIFPANNDPDVLARVRFGEKKPTSNVDDTLFNAIGLRRTTRTQFEQDPIPVALREQSIAAAAKYGITLEIITDEAIRANVAQLVSLGDRIQFSDSRFRKELASWVHSRRSPRKDGMSGEGFGMPDIMSPVGAFVIRNFDLGKGIAAGDKEKIMQGSPTLAVFLSPGDQDSDWLATGQALARALLHLTSAGITASYLNQPIELDDLRLCLKEMVGDQGMPQLLMRFGYAPAVRGTVRRDPKQVVIAA